MLKSTGFWPVLLKKKLLSNNLQQFSKLILASSTLNGPLILLSTILVERNYSVPPLLFSKLRLFSISIKYSDIKTIQCSSTFINKNPVQKPISMYFDRLIRLFMRCLLKGDSLVSLISSLNDLKIRYLFSPFTLATPTSSNIFLLVKLIVLLIIVLIFLKSLPVIFLKQDWILNLILSVFSYFFYYSLNFVQLFNSSHRW